MSKNIKYGLVVLTAILAIGCLNLFSPSCVGDECVASANNVKNAIPSPTVTPSASPTPTPVGALLCRIDFLVYDSGPTVLAINQEGTFSMTPWHTNEVGVVVKVPDSCNVPKAEFVVWTSSSAAGLVVKGEGGFQATAKRVGIGPFNVTAALDGRTVTRTVQ